MMLKATTAPFTQPKRTALVLVDSDQEAANDDLTPEDVEEEIRRMEAQRSQE